ncbi:MAG: hypothetical protein ACI9AT_000073 [Ulvibacter sp.]|jgi:hypothetical protein
MKTLFSCLALVCLCFNSVQAQEAFDGDQLGAWYMYFWNAKIRESKIGLQGDVQFRNWDLGGDLEQLLIRGGLTYSPENAKIKFTLGYGNITTGDFGESVTTSSESRIYQEALIPQKIGNISYLTHRFRYEQRFVETQDLRTRYRYNLFLNVPLNTKVIEPKSVYLALYNELFINGQRSIGDDRRVEIFDRNRSYGALGYMLPNKMKVQLGIMRQTTDNWAKNQLQLSLHHNFSL